MLRVACASLVGLLLVACHEYPTEPTAGAGSPSTPTAPDTTGRQQQVTTLEFGDSPRGLDFVGMDRWLYFYAYDQQGRSIDPADVVVRSSNATVANVREFGSNWYYQCDTSRGECWREWSGYVAVETVGVGTATISASLRGASDSSIVEVHGLPTAPATLVIDSLRVTEYVPACSGSCLYRAYVPTAWMHAPYGVSTERLEAIAFTVPSLPTMWCTYGGSDIAPDGFTFGGTIDPYLWNNDALVVSLTGPVSDSLATLQVIVSDENGVLRIAGATAAIERNGIPPLGEGASGC